MIKIEPATLMDVDALAAIEQQVFAGDRISRRQFTYLLTKSKGLMVKLEADGRVCGYLSLLTRKNSDRMRIYSIGVCRADQQRGYGRQLLGFAEQAAAKAGKTGLYLEVRADNHRALDWYCRAGFIHHATKAHYYEDGQAALLLAKTLSCQEKNDDPPRYGSTLHK